MDLEFFCNICYKAYAGANDFHSTKCGHVFHGHCIKDWLAFSKICPECGRTCSKSSLVKVFIKSRSIGGDDTQVTNPILATQLQQGVKKLNETQNLLDESERKFTELTNKLNSVTRKLTVLSRNKNEEYECNRLARQNDPIFRRRPDRGVEYKSRLEAQALDAFIYAQNLRKIGYKDIFFNGSSIFVKKNFSHPFVLIRSRDDVNELMYD